MQDNKITQSEGEAKVFELAKEIGSCMFTTVVSKKLHSRPMATTARPDQHDFVMLTAKSDPKVAELESQHEVVLNFAVGKRKFLALNGTARLNDDRALIKDVWSVGAQVFWPNGPTDPNVTAIVITPTHAEYWEGNGGMVASVKFAYAIAMHSTPDLGANKKLQM